MLTQNATKLLDLTVGVLPLRTQTAYAERVSERPCSVHAAGMHAAIAEGDPQRRPLNMDSVIHDARGAPAGPTVEHDVEHLNLIAGETLNV